ncbi:MAG: hypothetical protein MUQ25_01245 [Candidatus Aminicenantes bacterium]|nr:hypothetical protein [Candidatus Aminicenantes bacterium]
MSQKKAPFVLALAALSLAFAVTADLALAGQNPVARSTTLKKAKGLQVTNYVLRLPDAYIVYEPSKDVFQIAALGAVLSYGDGWERRQVKPYLFHIRHQSWKNHFWKVNTSRKEVYLVWGGVFGRIGTKPGAAPALEVDGEREDITLDVIGGAGDRVPERFFIRFGEADLFFDPVARDLRLAAAGVTLSPCDDWEACSLKDYLFHVRLKTWKGFFWKVNTSRLAAWWTTGGDFCKLGGEDKELALTMKSFQRPFSLARLRTVLAAAEKTRLREIADMNEAGRPIAEINRASVEFVRQFPGVDVDAAVSAIANYIKGLQAAMDKFEKEREGAMTSFENFDQKANQLFNILSTVMKNMKEMQSGIARNLL